MFEVVTHVGVMLPHEFFWVQSLFKSFQILVISSQVISKSTLTINGTKLHAIYIFGQDVDLLGKFLIRSTEVYYVSKL